MCAKAYFKKTGKDDLVLKELNKLPYQFMILRNVFLRLKWPVTYQKTSEAVKSCQIDYIVIGPSGIFVMEAKNWDECIFKEKIPHKEIDKAGLIMYIKLSRSFTKKIPIYNIVVTKKQEASIRYGFVHQLPVWQLTSFIYSQGSNISQGEIPRVRRLLLNKR